MTSALRIRILGCGSSGGVPRPGSGWGACDPGEPRNRRRRCSILLTAGIGATETHVLVDTSPDLREQLIDAHVTHLDAVLFTHEHADHTHGIDDLRPLVIHMRKRIDAWADDATGTMLRDRFGYIFETPPGSDYPPILVQRRLQAGRIVTLGREGREPIAALPFRVAHGQADALGFRVGRFAYAPDVSAVPADSRAAFVGLDLLVLDALRHTPHPTHFSVSQALDFIAMVRPTRTILTNLHTDLDYAALSAVLPTGVEPAHDGMELTVVA